MIDDSHLFKVLKEDGSPYWGGVRNWLLPNNNEPGEWISVEGELEETNSGLHLCRIRSLPFWIGPAIFSVEYDGEIINRDSDTPIVRKARLLYRVPHWNHDTLQAFAQDCYEHVRQPFENKGTIYKDLVESFEYSWTNKIYRCIPRQAAEISGRYELETAWQVDRLLQYLQK